MSTGWLNQVVPGAAVGLAEPAVKHCAFAPSLFRVNPEARVDDLMEFVDLGLGEITRALVEAVGGDGLEAGAAWRLRILAELIHAAQRAVVGQP